MASSQPKEVLEDLIKRTNAAIKLADQDEKHFFTAYLMAKKTNALLTDGNSYASVIIGDITNKDILTKMDYIQGWFNNFETKQKLKTKREESIAKLNNAMKKNSAEIEKIQKTTEALGKSLVEANAELDEKGDDLQKALSVEDRKTYASRSASYVENGTENEAKKEAIQAKRAAKQAASEFHSARASADQSARKANTQTMNLNYKLGKLEEEKSKLTRHLNLISEPAFESIIVVGIPPDDREELKTFVNTLQIENLEIQIQQLNVPPASCSGLSCFGRGGGRTRRKRKGKGKKTRRRMRR